MRYDNQVLFDKGFTTLAYQLEAMMDKAPVIDDDFSNLTTIILDAIDTLEERANELEAEALDNGYQDGYSQAEWDYGDRYDEGFDDGKSEGYEEGYQDGLNDAREDE